MVLTRGKGMVKRNMSVLLRLFPIVPLVLLIVTLALTVSARNKLKNCGECTGTILRMEKFTSASGSTLDGESTIAPVVEYEVDGQRYEFVGRYASSSMKAGDRVQVLYDRADHSKAYIKNGVYAAPLILGAVTAVSLIALVILLALRGRGAL